MNYDLSERQVKDMNQQIMRGAFATLQQQINDVQQRVSKLEKGV